MPTNGTTEEVQETADARCRERRCCRLQPKEKIVNVEPPTVLEEQELMAEADGYCSRAAPPSGAVSCPEVAHRAVVELAQVLEQ